MIGLNILKDLKNVMILGLIPVNTYLLATIGIIMGIAGASMAYMISQAFQLPQLKGWAIQEITETIKTILIVFFIVAGLDIVGKVILILIGVPPTSTLTDTHSIIISMAKMYFHTMRTELYSIYWYLIPANFMFGLLSATTITAFTVTFNVWGMSTLLTKALTQLINNVTMAIMLLAAQEVVLDFFKETAMTIFLPLGIIMRAIPITRKTGSTIIAFAIVGFFVYPATIMFNEFIYFNYAFGNYDYADSTNTQLIMTDIGYESGFSHGDVDFNGMEFVREMDNLSEGTPEGYISPSSEGNRTPNPSEITYETWEADATAFENEIINGTEFDELQEETDPDEYKSTWLEVVTNPLKTLFTVLVDKVINLVSNFTWIWDGIKLIWYMCTVDSTFIYEEGLMVVTKMVSIQMHKLIIIMTGLLIDYLICMTILKDISGLIGGEKRIWGIEKIKVV